ncbi:uncharacterized protein BP5553_01891 [Venustampulla echinocandica]|uniref:DNA polymerase lambda n=1 Tax=Venustampulla echinocandica TaxID=2656787 RepID=A0A370U2A7_9HELO|nr:uncharacterized protein BP5553_01891 [Venustampulla echinocandica]RDL41912.1 hypothetical protein BP5553_01891 [Venustampulla echinocandica]
MAALYFTATLLSSHATTGRSAFVHPTRLPQSRLVDSQSAEHAPPLNLIRELPNIEGQHEQLNPRDIETGPEACNHGDTKDCLDSIVKRFIDKVVQNITEEDNAFKNPTRTSDGRPPKRCGFLSSLIFWRHCHTAEVNNSSRDERASLLGFLPRSNNTIRHFPDLTVPYTAKLQKRSCEWLEGDSFTRCINSRGLSWFQATLVVLSGVLLYLVCMLGLLLCMTRWRANSPHPSTLRTMTNTPIAPSPDLNCPETAMLSPVEEVPATGLRRTGLRQVDDVEAQTDGTADFPATLGLDGCSDTWRQWIEYKHNREAAEADKIKYFDQLYALKQSSDEEEDTHHPREVVWPRSRTIASKFPPSSQPSERRNQPSDSQNKVPSIHRTNSAPVSSVSIANESSPARKSSLLRYGVSTPPSVETSFDGKPPPAGPSSPQYRPNMERRTVSDPVAGSLVLKNSSGITSMLQKKQKRKREPSIKLAPEKERVFQGLTFFYIPPDDIAPLRRARITKAKSFGAIWTKDFGMDVTHVVVDKALTYQSIVQYLKSAFRIDSLPGNVVLVNENYPVECIQFRSLLDPRQNQYAVTGSPVSVASPTIDKHPGVEGPNKGDREYDLRIQTPPRQEPSTQEKSPEEVPTPKIWRPSGEPKKAKKIVKSPQEASPPKNIRTVRENGDALDEMIEIAMKTKDLPLDDDDDSSGPPSSNGPEDSDNSDDSRERSPNRAAWKKRRKGPKGTMNQENFSCMTGGTGTSSKSNPNAATIESFKELASYYERIRDPWRPMAYRRAVTALRKQTKKVVSKDEALLIPYVGESIAEKIQEIAIKGHLRKLDYAKLEPNDLILQTFTKIYGVGLTQAYKWIQQGYKTLDDIKSHVRLNDNQRIGIDHYDDFNTRIPQDQMTSLGEIVKKAVAGIDADVEVIIGGSYRRGATSSGDIDFILSKPGTQSSSDLLPFLNTLVTHLTETGFLAAALAVPRSCSSASDSGSKWHGVCVLPGNPIWRRIDFLLVPEPEMGAALLYFTGDDIFNRSMRLLASKRGMRLNQRGLYKDVLRGPGRVKITDGSLVEGRDERKIFEVLGVPWRPPEQRILN